MTTKATFIAVLFSLMASQAGADMIVINGRFVVAKDTIRSLFYRDSNQSTVLDVRWSDWSTKYRCDDTYEPGRVEAASLNFALQLSDARALDFREFLESEGFTNCEAF